MLSTMTKRFKSEQVERLDGDVGAVQAPLEQRPAVLDAGDVDLAVDVPLGVVDDLVVVVAGQPDLGLECVAVDRSALFEVLADPGFGGWPAACPARPWRAARRRAGAPRRRSPCPCPRSR